MRDFTTDSVPRPLIAAGVAGTLPDWALAVPIPQVDELAKLASAAFADPVHRMLPLHTKAAALCSAVYFATYEGIYPEGTEERIKAAAVSLGVAAEAEFILLAARPKEAAAAAPATKSAHALEIGNGADYGLAEGPLNLLPCHDSYAVEHSGEELAKCASSKKLPPEMVYSAAVALVKAASEKNCLDTLPPHIVSLGTERVADWSKAALLVLDRAKLVGPDGLPAYNDLIKLGSEHPEFADDIIDGLRDLDAQTGIDYWHKAGAVASPWEIVYCGPTLSDIEKMANSHFVLGGALVPLPVLSAMPQEKLTAYFSKSAAATIKEAQDAADSAATTKILGTLPDDVQERLFNKLAEQ